MVNFRVFKPLPLCLASLKTLLVVISGVLGMKESHFLNKNMFCENAVGYLRYNE